MRGSQFVGLSPQGLGFEGPRAFGFGEPVKDPGSRRHGWIMPHCGLGPPQLPRFESPMIARIRFAPPGTYCVRVRALNYVGPSAPSNEVMVTVP